MSKTNIKIKSLQIRLKNISPHTARAASEGLAESLAAELSRDAGAKSGGASVNVEEVKPRALTAERGTSPAALRRLIATHIAASVKGKIGKRS
ncbi:MAG TPA: hypothetical protein VGC91_10805 [Pyrinomonadaceae bacterium]|jgi:hypothetical protein